MVKEISRVSGCAANQGAIDSSPVRTPQITSHTVAKKSKNPVTRWPPVTDARPDAD